MTTTFTGYDDTVDDDRAALRRFIAGVRVFLDKLVTERIDPTGAPLFFSNFPVDLMIDAWDEARPTFDNVDAALGDASGDDLRQHGLFGKQLRFKLGVVRFLHNRYVKVGKKILGPLLAAIDSVLDSILDVVGVGKAAKEIKECIGAGIEAVPEG